MLLKRVVQYGALELDPGVRLEPAIVFPGPDSYFCSNPASPQQPAEHERLLQTIGAQKKMPGSRLLEPCDRARRTKRNRITRSHPPRGFWHEPVQNARPTRVSSRAQANPRRGERHRSFDNQTARVCAQAPEPAPSFYYCFQPCTLKKVAQRLRDSPFGWEERVPKGRKGSPGCKSGGS